MDQKPQLLQHIHLEEDEDTGSLDRDYRITEGRLQYKGREVLYVISETAGFTCCDGSYSPRLETVNVIGYVVRWKYGTNEKGMPVSEIEPINEKDTKQEIREILKKLPYIKA